MAVTGDARIPAAGRFGDKPNLKRREEKMTMQQKDTADPQTVQQQDLRGDAKAGGEFTALGMKVDDAFNNNDAAALARLSQLDAKMRYFLGRIGRRGA